MDGARQGPVGEERRARTPTPDPQPSTPIPNPAPQIVTLYAITPVRWKQGPVGAERRERTLNPDPQPSTLIPNPASQIVTLYSISWAPKPRFLRTSRTPPARLKQGPVGEERRARINCASIASIEHKSRINCVSIAHKSRMNCHNPLAFEKGAGWRGEAGAHQLPEVHQDRESGS